MRDRLHQKLASFSRDFTYQPEGGIRSPGLRSSFITHDTELMTLVRIDDHYDNLDAYSVGIINGHGLQLHEKPPEGEDKHIEAYYRKFLNSDGQCIFDLYEVTYNPEQDVEVYQLEKYQIEP